MVHVSDATDRSASMTRVAICGAGDVPRGEMRPIRIDGVEPLAVFNIDGVYHVTADTCSHAQAFLSDGDLEGDRVVCPAHWAEFHVPTGRPKCFPATRGIATYSVTVEGDVVFADLADPRPGEPA